MTAPLPLNEEDRILALEAFRILDTPAEEAYDRLARIAKHVLDVPIALVSLVDRDRQWFKACFGLDVSETGRDVAFCAHAIHSDDILMVPDARDDPRFADNPLVTGPPGIRFYAGAPLIASEGVRLGTLCVIDAEPRAGLSDRESAVLRDLADAVVAQLQLRRTVGLSEQRRQATADAAEEQNRLLSWLGHELRTPMTAVLGFAELLASTGLDPLQQRHVDHVLSGGRRMLGLIEDLLDISRAEAGRLELASEPVAVDDVLAAVRPMVLGAAAKQSVTVKAPAGTEGLWVRGDATRLEQVVLNFLTNAVKYNRPGGEVAVDVAVVDGPVRISVTDTGIGIAPEDRDRVFAPFVRVETSQEGAGLGLALSRAFVEGMGGTVGVESRPDHGSTFWAELPPAEAPAPVTAAPSEDRVVGSVVLYIEDDPANQALIERLVHHVGDDIEVHTADDAGSGVAVARRVLPEVILLDLNLPDADGLDVLAELRTISDAPVVILSGEASPNRRERLLVAGAAAYVTKPLDVAAFVALVRELLGRTA